MEAPKRTQGLRRAARRLREYGQEEGNGMGKPVGAGVVGRIATNNAGTLLHREQEVVAWMKEEGVDTLCVQEVRLNGGDRRVLERAAADEGYHVLWGEEDWSRDGFPERGVAIITRAQGYQVKAGTMPDPRRVVVMRCHREGARPLLVIGIYAHAGDLDERGRLIAETLAWAVRGRIS